MHDLSSNWQRIDNNMTDTNKLDIDAVMAESVALLKNNLEKYPPFDPNKPYEEKNLYFNDQKSGFRTTALHRKLIRAATLRLSQSNDKAFPYSRVSLACTSAASL